MRSASSIGNRNERNPEQRVCASGPPFTGPRCHKLGTFPASNDPEKQDIIAINRRVRCRAVCCKLGCRGTLSWT